MKYLSLLIVLFCGSAMADMKMPDQWRLVDISTTPHEAYEMPMGELQFNRYNGRLRMPIKIYNLDSLTNRYLIIEMSAHHCMSVDATVYVNQYPRGEFIEKVLSRRGDTGIYTEIRRIICAGVYNNPEAPKIEWNTGTPYGQEINIYDPTLKSRK